MDTPKIFESEFRFCQILWDHEPVSSTELVRLCRERLGWKKSTTYTVIKKLIDKGAVARSDPGFVCAPLITRREVQRQETDSLITRLFGGSKAQFLSAFLAEKDLTPAQAAQLRALIETLETR